MYETRANNWKKNAKLYIVFLRKLIHVNINTWIGFGLSSCDEFFHSFRLWLRSLWLAETKLGHLWCILCCGLVHRKSPILQYQSGSIKSTLYYNIGQWVLFRLAVQTGVPCLAWSLAAWTMSIVLGGLQFQ